jgi:hypothetical protein
VCGAKGAGAEAVSTDWTLIGLGTVTQACAARVKEELLNSKEEGNEEEKEEGDEVECPFWDEDQCENRYPPESGKTCDKCAGLMCACTRIQRKDMLCGECKTVK